MLTAKLSDKIAGKLYIFILCITYVSELREMKHLFNFDRVLQYIHEDK